MMMSSIVIKNLVVIIEISSVGCSVPIITIHTLYRLKAYQYLIKELKNSMSEDMNYNEAFYTNLNGGTQHSKCIKLWHTWLYSLLHQSPYIMTPAC